MNAQKQWFDVLGIGGRQIDEAVVERTYRRLAKQRHPDAGGSHEAMTDLNLAKDAALQWVASERKKKVQAAQQAEAAKRAAEYAAFAFQNSYQQQMQQMAGISAQYQQAANAHLGSVMGAACGAVAAAAKEEKRKTKLQRIREIFRGKNV